jgi:hypothetical protein
MMARRVEVQESGEDEIASGCPAARALSSVNTGRSENVTWEGSDDELLDVRQAAALLTVKPSTLAYWAREGRVPVIRLGPRATRWTRPLLRGVRDAALDRGRDF